MRYIFLSLMAFVSSVCAQVELGKVKWDRKLEPVLQKAGEDGKPIFLLFQEIPG